MSFSFQPTPASDAQAVDALASSLLSTKALPPGTVIYIEGMDGSGKSSLAARLAQALNPSDPQAVIASALDRTLPLSKAIHDEVILNDCSAKKHGLSVAEQMYLEVSAMNLARLEMLNATLRPIVQRFGFAICDRGPLSTLSHQIFRHEDFAAFLDPTQSYFMGSKMLKQAMTRAVTAIHDTSYSKSITAVLDINEDLRVKRVASSSKHSTPYDVRTGESAASQHLAFQQVHSVYAKDNDYVRGQVSPFIELLLTLANSERRLTQYTISVDMDAKSKFSAEGLTVDEAALVVLHGILGD